MNNSMGVCNGESIIGCTAAQFTELSCEITLS